MGSTDEIKSQVKLKEMKWRAMPLIKVISLFPLIVKKEKDSSRDTEIC